MDPGSELVSLLGPSVRPDVRVTAVECVLGLSGTPEGRRSLCALPGLAAAILALTSDSPVIREAYHILVNLTSDPGCHRPLLELPALLPTLIDRLLDPGCRYADSVCSALCNLSREAEPCRSLLNALPPAGPGRIVDLICGPESSKSPDYLGPLLCNLTQLPEGRGFLLDRSRCVIQRLLPLTHTPSSAICRGGIVGTLRNCCFNHRDHSWLLGDVVDILPFLLLPLAGGEEYTDEEMETLPADLQYLPEDKQREADPDIRNMLIECLQLLCATQKGRRTLRDRGAYLILRSLHSWEKEPAVRRTCEKVIQVLIGDEPEAGLENLLEVSVPSEVQQQLQRLDEQEERELQEESAM